MYTSPAVPRAIAVAAPRPAVQTHLLLWVAAFTVLSFAFSVCSAHGATYYVATTGSDSAAGTATAPWRSISWKLPTLQGGDVVIWKNGTYTESIDLSLLPLTTTPVTLKAENSRGATLQGGGAFFTIGSNVHVNGAVRIEGFRITDGAMGIGFDQTGDNITIVNCEIWGCIEGFRLRGGKNLTITDSNLHDNQYGWIMGVKDVSGIAGITIERTIAANNALAGQTGNTDGFVIEGFSTNVVIRDCVSHGAGDSGFDMKPDGTLLERCLSYNNNGMGMKLWGSNDKIINCIVYGNKIEGVATGGDNLQFWGDTICNNAANGIRFENANTSTCIVRDCILYNNPVWVLGTTMYNDDYNCYYSGSGSYVIRVGSTTYTMAQVAAHTVPVGSHSDGHDPMMVSPGTADFRLSSTSACNGAGLANSLIAVDYYAVTRPNPPDKGAIENGGGSAPIVPTAPTQVVITAGGTTGTAADLMALASGSTVSNGSTITYQYQWTVSTDGGSTWSAWGYTGQTLPKSNLADGQQWMARACATVDSTNYSAWTNSAVTTISAGTTATPPTAPTSVTIAPSPATVTSDLRATASGSVSSTGAAVTYQVQWSVSADGGTTWGAWGYAGNVLLSSNLSVGQLWRARACATDDGATYSAWTVSAAVTIVNGTTTTPTRPTSVVITPSAPVAGSTLKANVTPTAPAGISYQYQWRINNGSWGYSSFGDTVPGSWVKAGQKWQARARATNGTTTSTYRQSQTVTIGSGGGTTTNVAPTAPTSVTVSPNTPSDGNTLTPQASGSTDANGDAITYQYRWYYSQDGGTTWNLYGTVATLDAGLTGVGELWKAQARAFDGALYSTWTMSAPVTIH